MPERTFRMPETTCPHCQHTLSACSPPSGLDSPSPGDLSICIQCGGFLEIASDLTMQALEDGKLLHIRTTDPSGFATLMVMREAVLKVQKDRVKGGDRNG